MQNEIQILREIDHPNLIKLDSVYETKNSYYLLFELFSGGNLFDYIKKNGPFSEIQACHILKGILEGLKYLHKKNIIHRDIKPENILFRTENIFDANQVVIADFGLATHNDVEEYLFPRCGTPGFVAPEIFYHNRPTEHYSLKSDLYGVGVTFFYMLTGTLPYYGLENILQENESLRFDPYKLMLVSYEGLFSLIFRKKNQILI